MARTKRRPRVTIGAGIIAANRRSMTIETIDLVTLDLVTGGAAQSRTTPPKPVTTKPRPLATHRVGNTKIINNQSLDDMYWEVKPF